MTPLQARYLLWSRGELRFLLWDQQQVIYDTVRNLPNTVQQVVILCARQFGKSVTGCVLALEDAIKNPNSVILIIGPTIKQTRAIVVPRMKMLLRDAPNGLIRFLKSEDIFHLANGSEIRLGGFDTNAASERGKTLCSVYMEETGESNPDEYMSYVRDELGPAMTHSKHAKITHLSTLPKFPDHPFVIETIPEAQADGSFFKFTIKDNKQLSEDQYKACVKLCGGEHTEAFLREYMCKQIRDSSIVLAPEFSDELHVKEITIPEFCIYWIGGDLGGTADRHCLHLMTYDFERNKILILDEREFPPSTSTAEIVANAKEMEGERKIKYRMVDAPGQTRIDMCGFYSYPVIEPRKDELDATVNQVRKAMAMSEVEISPKCLLLIRTLRSGCWNKARTDLERTAALGHCDAFMSLAYGLRHADRTNPFPMLRGNAPNGWYISESANIPNGTAQTLKSIFAR